MAAQAFDWDAHNEKFGKRIAEQNTTIWQLREEVRMLEQQISNDATEAHHFRTMMRAVQENELVRTAWERFMMSLRMAGYDGTN